MARSLESRTLGKNPAAFQDFFWKQKKRACRARAPLGNEGSRGAVRAPDVNVRRIARVIAGGVRVEALLAVVVLGDGVEVERVGRHLGIRGAGVEEHIEVHGGGPVDALRGAPAARRGRLAAGRRRSGDGGTRGLQPHHRGGAAEPRRRSAAGEGGDARHGNFLRPREKRNPGGRVAEPEPSEGPSAPREPRRKIETRVVNRLASAATRSPVHARGGRAREWPRRGRSDANMPRVGKANIRSIKNGSVESLTTPLAAGESVSQR